MTTIERENTRAVTDGEHQRWTVTVSVRIPRNGGEALPRAVASRLRRNSQLAEVEVIDLCGLVPGLAATVATCTVHFVTRSEFERDGVNELLETMTAVEDVRGIERRS